MNGIDAIQQQQIYRVNPVNLFERREQNNNPKSYGNIFTQGQFGYNLEHPVVAGSPTQARNLDLLA